MGEKNSFIDFESMIDSAERANVINLSTDSSKEEELLKMEITNHSAKAEAELLFKSAQDENEKLLLRNNVVQGSYSDNVKVKILDLLDEYIKTELKEEIILSDSIEEIKKDKSNLLPGVVVMVVIGFIVSVFFPIAWIIGIVLAVAGYISSKKDYEAKMQKALIALEKVEKFRKAGYRI